MKYVSVCKPEVTRQIGLVEECLLTKFFIKTSVEFKSLGAGLLAKKVSQSDIFPINVVLFDYLQYIHL